MKNKTLKRRVHCGR